MNEKLETQTPKEEIKMVETKNINIAKKLSPITIIILFIFLLIPIAGFFFFRFNNDGTESVKTTICNNTQCPTKEKCDFSKQGEEVIPVALKPVNTGWAIFSDPAIKVSIEIPNFSKAVLKPESDTLSSWIAGILTRLTYVPDEFPNYVKGINASFYPQSTSDLNGGGPGSFAEHSISINVYTNTENKTLEDIKTSFATKERFAFGEGGGTTIFATVKVENKWGEEVCSYSYKSTEYTANGYLVVKNGFIYDVSYFFSDRDAESLSVAQEVLNSIKFN